MEYTWKELSIVIFGSSGFIGGLLTFLVFVAGRFDERRKRFDIDKAADFSESLEFQKLKADSHEKSETTLTINLWKLIEDQKSEIQCLKDELKDCEQGDKLTTKNVNKIFECVRVIKNEMDSLNIMILSDEDTNVFARRWGNIKAVMVDLEKTLNGD